MKNNNFEFLMGSKHLFDLKLKKPHIKTCLAFNNIYPHFIGLGYACLPINSQEKLFFLYLDI